MYETLDEIQLLQTLLSQSIEQAGIFLRESFQMPEHSLSASQLIYFWQGVQTIALATVTKNADPRVAPVGALLFHGRFYVPTVATAMRTKHIVRGSALSFSCYQGNDFAIIGHGSAIVIHPGHPDFVIVEAFQRDISGHSVQEWGEGIFLQINPRTLYTYARHPDTYPQ